MALDGLGDATFARVELHCALDLERAGVCAVSCDADKGHPFVVCAYAVVDDLAACERRVAVEHFHGRRGGVCDGPVIYGSFRDEAEGIVVDPLPEHDVLVVHVRLDLLLRLEIRDLERAPAGLEGEDALVRVHDHAVGRDGPSQHIVRVGQVDNHHLVQLPDLLPDGNEAVRLERQRLCPTRQYNPIQLSAHSVLPGKRWRRVGCPGSRAAGAPRTGSVLKYPSSETEWLGREEGMAVRNKLQTARDRVDGVDARALPALPLRESRPCPVTITTLCAFYNDTHYLQQRRTVRPLRGKYCSA